MLTINNTIDGAIQDIEIKGNTVQDPDNLADIKSVGVLQEDDTYKMSILSCGKNLFDGNKFTPREAINQYSYIDGILTMSCDGQAYRRVDYILPNTLVHGKRYILTANVKALEYSSGYTPGQNFGYGYYNGGSADYYGYFDASSNTTKLEFVYNEQGENVIGFHNEVKEGLIKLQWSNIQLEEGTVATSYEPYQGNKCDILLPCQLEKVGDVSDRLYYDDVEKAWCIEKNIVKIPLYESVNKINGDWETLYFSKTLSFDKVKNANSYCISSLLNYNGQDISTENTITQLCIVRHANNFECRIRLRKDEFPNITTNEDYIKWATENDFYILLQSASPQKIVLPLSTQIALNSFFGTTHIYMESGEVEGIIKCKIPKSLGATVQSLNNKTDILSDRIEAIEGLKDSQNMKYETDKGYLVCKETKNGVIDDLKLEGKTLVNLWDINKMRKASSISVNDNYVTVNADGSWIDCHPVYTAGKVPMLKPNTEYTVITHIKTNTLNGAFYVNIDSANRSPYTSYYSLDIGFTGYHIHKLRTKTDLSGADTTLRCQVGDSCTTGQIIFNCIVLEGDHTQNPPSYFEGLMSVGQDVDEIEVLSNNGNLFDGKLEVGGIKGANGADDNNATSWRRSSYVKVCSPNIVHILKQAGTKYIFEYDNNKNFIKYTAINDMVYVLKLNSNCRYIRVAYNFIPYETIHIGVNTTVTEYTPHQSNKKQILFYNENGELEPVQELHEWDSIEKHSDNKWYYHKRSGKVVLNGSESWQEGLSSQFTDTHMYFACNSFDSIMKDSSLISDKFENKPTWDILSRECIDSVTSMNKLRIRLAKSKLSTQDVEGFKQWLQANNVTVVYQLAEEEVYELAPLHLDSYANETLILCNSGAISPKMEFSITSHINELVKAYGERINLLEEKVYQYMIAQNRLQLASTYSADSVTFKVDYFSLCGDEENYDEDLYNLILNNILVGKDNYDYDKMFTMILDYASWNQISWEQFDILVGLMDIQHNPPVEELPTEDEIEEDIIENEETPVE